MATGINTDKSNALKVELLGYIESFNAIKNRIDNCKTIVQANMDGAGKAEIIKLIDAIMDQIPKVNDNINAYITTIGKIEKSYEDADETLGSVVTKNVTKVGNN